MCMRMCTCMRRARASSRRRQGTMLWWRRCCSSGRTQTRATSEARRLYRTRRCGGAWRRCACSFPRARLREEAEATAHCTRRCSAARCVAGAWRRWSKRCSPPVRYAHVAARHVMGDKGRCTACPPPPRRSPTRRVRGRDFGRADSADGR